jgi:restriction system protein
MTATHNQPRRTRPRKTTRRTTGRRLPSFTWGGVAITVICLYIAARTWPVQAIILAVLIGTAALVRVIRPRRLARLWSGLEWIAEHRRALPRNTRGRRTLDTFLRMHHDRFEHAIADLASEHPDVRHASKSGGTGDRGLDVLVELRNGARILIQCKHYAPGHNNVGGPAVREIVGSVIANSCHFGAIVTTSDFTADAYATNNELGPNRLALINGHGLEQWANGGRPPWQ